MRKNVARSGGCTGKWFGRKFADAGSFKAESRVNHPLTDRNSEHFLSRAGCGERARPTLENDKFAVVGTAPGGRPQPKTTSLQWVEDRTTELRGLDRRRRRPAGPAADAPAPGDGAAVGPGTATSSCTGGWGNWPKSGAGAPVWKCCAGSAVGHAGGCGGGSGLM